MASDNHTRAFVYGALLGGIAAAAYVIFHAPASGAEIRGDVAADVENTIYRWMGMDKPRGIDGSELGGTATVLESGVLNANEN